MSFMRSLPPRNVCKIVCVPMCLGGGNPLVSRRSLYHQILQPLCIVYSLFLKKTYTRQTKGPQNACFCGFFPPYFSKESRSPRCVMSKITSVTLTTGDWMGIHSRTQVDHIWVEHTGGPREGLDRNSAQKSSPYWMAAI